MNINVDIITIVVTVAIAVVAGAWTLYRWIRRLDAKANESKCVEHARHLLEVKSDTNKAVEHAEEKFALEQQKVILKIDYLEKEVEALSKKQEREHSKHDELISGIRDVLADMRETIAGFGKDFVTRREFLESKRRDGDA